MNGERGAHLTLLRPGVVWFHGTPVGVPSVFPLVTDCSILIHQDLEVNGLTIDSLKYIHLMNMIICELRIKFKTMNLTIIYYYSY